MEAQFTPAPSQPETPSMDVSPAQPIGQSSPPSTTTAPPPPPESLAMQPQAMQSAPQAVPTLQPSVPQQEQMQQQPAVPQPLHSLSKKSLLIYFILINLVLFVVGFGGAWIYRRYFTSTQYPTSDRQGILPASFSAFVSNEYTDQQAIQAIKKAYPDLKDVELFNDQTDPKTFIRTQQTTDGWKVRFTRVHGKCRDESPGCSKEQWYYFSVDNNGNVTKVGEAEVIFDLTTGDTTEENGTRFTNFFSEK